MEKMERIPVAGPSITQREISYVTDAVTRCWHGEANYYHERFERAFAGYVGVRHAVALPSCTSAIHLALAAMGVGPGDEVVVPDVTWIASAAPIKYVGAEPVFADVDSDSWCLSAEAFERSLSPRTKAVISVDLYGNLPDVDAIRKIARRRGVAVIEDAAEALGTTSHGRQAGSLGDVGVFSFHGSKTLTTGEGGMLVTDDDELYQRVLFLRDHGRVPGDVSFQNAEVAFKYKMSSMQAALGLAQLERVEELVARKREVFSWYADELRGVPGLSLNQVPPHVLSSYWMTTLVADAETGLDQGLLGRQLSAAGIDTRPFFNPLSSLAAYAGTPAAARARRENTVAYDLSPRGINLPSGLTLTRAQVAYVCGHLRELFTAMTHLAPVLRGEGPGPRGVGGRFRPRIFAPSRTIPSEDISRAITPTLAPEFRDERES